MENWGVLKASRSGFGVKTILESPDFFVGSNASNGLGLGEGFECRTVNVTRLVDLLQL